MLSQPLLLSIQADKKPGDLDLNQLQSFLNMILRGMEWKESGKRVTVLLLSQILNKQTEGTRSLEVLHLLKVQTPLYTASVFSTHRIDLFWNQ